jgi:hypothetical protein
MGINRRARTNGINNGSTFITILSGTDGSVIITILRDIDNVATGNLEVIGINSGGLGQARY